MSKKLYFDGPDSERCYSIEWHQAELNKTNSLEEKTRILYEAKRLTGEQFFFCKALQEIGEVGESCRNCIMYRPNNGKNGRCKDYGYTYEPTEKTKTINRICK